MHLFFKNKFWAQSLCLFAILCTQTACSDDDPVDECVAITATLAASITSSAAAVCSGESAELTIAGTPEAVVDYTDGTTSNSATLDASGNAIIAVNPSESTDYTLEKITLSGCDKSLSESVSLTIGGPAIAENLVGTWTVTNVNDQTDGKTVVFEADGSGTAPMDGSFSMYSSTLLEHSDGFTWEHDTIADRIIIRYNFTAIDYPVHYEVDLNDCDEIILRDVTHVVDPQHAFSLARM